MKNLALHIMDIVQNSIRAEANYIILEIDENLANHTVTICISDNGKGMTADFLKKVTDPFVTSRTTRKVGLGIPLFKQNAERTGGNFFISSQVNRGTSVKAIFKTDHYDCLPMGDVAGVVSLMVGSNPQIRFVYRHKTGKGVYIFDTEKIKEILEGVPISHPDVIQFIKEMINDNIKNIQNI